MTTPAADHRSDSAAELADPSALEQGLRGEEAQAADPHGHGPQPSYEWMIEGEDAMVIPHLKSIAPTLTWKEEHFHVRDVEVADPDLPALHQVELGDEPVGALDFLPLPQKRTLMRLFLCSDLGTTCSLESGNDVMQGFATAWIQRLAALGFMTIQSSPGAERRPMGFAIPSPPAPENATPEGPAAAALD